MSVRPCVRSRLCHAVPRRVYQRHWPGGSGHLLGAWRGAKLSAKARASWSFAFRRARAAGTARWAPASRSVGDIAMAWKAQITTLTACLLLLVPARMGGRPPGEGGPRTHELKATPK